MNTIKRLLGITLALAGFAFVASVQAQSLTTTTQLSSANVVPPIVGLDASGTATITVTPTLDNSGVITGGSVHFLVNFTFPSPVNITGIHIHQAAVGQNGPIAADTNIIGSSPTTSCQGCTFNAPNVSAAAIQSIIANPTGFYVDIHTNDNPDGAIRGQLTPFTVAALTGITCQTVCFQSPAYFATLLAVNPFNIPRGVITIPGDNFFGPVLTTAPFKPFLILYMLKPLGTLAIPTNPFLRLRRVFIAVQLSLLSGRFFKGSEPAVFNATLSCHGITITPIVLSNGALITNNTSLEMLIFQAELAFATNNAADMTALATVFELLTAGSTGGTCQ